MSDSDFKFELRDDGVLIVYPHGPLRTRDFDKLAELVDPWINAKHELQGIVINVEKFPGWENLKGFISHIKFVGSHERKVRRVALAVDGLLPEFMAQFTKHFIKAEVKQFAFSNLEGAILWARGEKVMASPNP